MLAYTLKVGDSVQIPSNTWSQAPKWHLKDGPGAYVLLQDVPVTVGMNISPTTKANAILRQGAVVRPQYASENPFGVQVQYVTIQSVG